MSTVWALLLRGPDPGPPVKVPAATDGSPLPRLVLPTGVHTSVRAAPGVPPVVVDLADIYELVPRPQPAAGASDRAPCRYVYIGSGPS